tara:strand:+ start:376 stop:606 length:231 start_codon:yes stop_codon:yes gene_type:complete
MNDIININDVYEIRDKKKKELNFYQDQLKELQEKLFFLEKEIGMTEFIIKVIEQENIYKKPDEIEIIDEFEDKDGC